jgi:hypothetical protein
MATNIAQTLLLNEIQRTRDLQRQQLEDQSRGDARSRDWWKFTLGAMSDVEDLEQKQFQNAQQRATGFGQAAAQLGEPEPIYETPHEQTSAKLGYRQQLGDQAQERQRQEDILTRMERSKVSAALQSAEARAASLARQDKLEQDRAKNRTDLQMLKHKHAMELQNKKNSVLDQMRRGGELNRNILEKAKIVERTIKALPPLVRGQELKRDATIQHLAKKYTDLAMDERLSYEDRTKLQDQYDAEYDALMEGQRGVELTSDPEQSPFE